MDIYKLIECN